MTWMTQTHSTICHTVNEQIPFTALIGDGDYANQRSCVNDDDSRLFTCRAW